MHDLTLNLKDRVIQANQYRILEKLYPNEAKEFALVREALESGYMLEYGHITEHFSEELSVDECREVYEILDMYRILGSAYGDLPDTDGIPTKAVRFPGFDGNDETQYYAYARFLIEDQGRWEEANSRNLNTHRPMLRVYREMLRRWNESTDKFALSKEEVRHILAAAI